MEKEIQKLINEYKNKLLKNRTDNENELSMYKAIHRESTILQLEKNIKDLENILKESKTKLTTSKIKIQLTKTK